MQDSSSPHTDVFPAFEPPIREICLAHSPQVELRPETLYVTAPWPHQHQEAFSLRCAQAGARALTSYTPEQDALALQQGVPVEDVAELQQRLEDYGW